MTPNIDTKALADLCLKFAEAAQLLASGQPAGDAIRPIVMKLSCSEAAQTVMKRIQDDVTLVGQVEAFYRDVYYPSQAPKKEMILLLSCGTSDADIAQIMEGQTLAGTQKVTQEAVKSVRESAMVSYACKDSEGLQTALEAMVRTYRLETKLAEVAQKRVGLNLTKPGAFDKPGLAVPTP